MAKKHFTKKELEIQRKIRKIRSEKDKLYKESLKISEKIKKLTNKERKLY